MKKLTLFVFVLLCATLATAQTSSLNSNNQPAASDMGYLFDFKGNAADNCPTMIPYNQWNIATSYTVNSAGNDTLVVSTDGTQKGWEHLNLRLYDGNCSATTIDMSTNATLSMVVRSTMNVPQCMIILFDANGNAADNNPPVIALVPGLNTLTASTLDWKMYGTTTEIDKTQVAVVGLYFRTSYDDNDAGGVSPTVAGTFRVAHIKLGDQTGLTTTGVQKADVSDHLLAYPNPSHGNLTVSLDQNVESTLSLCDLTGNVVFTTTLSGNSANINTSGLPKGMYILKAESAHQIGHKKIIVQ